MVAPRCLVSKVTRHNMGPLGIQKIVKLNKIESSSIWSVVVDVVVLVVVVVVVVVVILSQCRDWCHCLDM